MKKEKEKEKEKEKRIKTTQIWYAVLPVGIPGYEVTILAYAPTPAEAMVIARAVHPGEDLSLMSVLPADFIYLPARTRLRDYP